MTMAQGILVRMPEEGIFGKKAMVSGYYCQQAPGRGRLYIYNIEQVCIHCVYGGYDV
jgi:hypothetical protein